MDPDSDKVVSRPGNLGVDVERLVATTHQRLKCCDHQAIFAHGSCFLFALRWHELHGFKIHGFRQIERGQWTHVWAMADAKTGVDIRGVYPEELLAKLANGGEDTPKPEDIDPGQIRAVIESKHYPAGLLKDLTALADRIISTHERFEIARPPADRTAYASFVADLHRGAESATAQ